MRRRATDADTWAGLVTPVTYLHEDGRVERYDVPVEVWVVDGPQTLADAAKRRELERPASVRVETKAWKPSYVDEDGVPTFVFSR